MNCPECDHRAWVRRVRKSGGRRFECPWCGHRFSIGMLPVGRPRKPK